MAARLAGRRLSQGMNRARSVVRQVCGIAGQITWVDDLRDETGLVGAVAAHNTAVIFDWLIREVSHQGISDAVADGYIDRHGNVTWAEIEGCLATNPSCDKLEGYWGFTDCRYHKGFQTCRNPNHFPNCPLPRHRLRNGRLNQSAYSLFLFIRDIAGGDIVDWIDRQLADHLGNLPAARTALVDPLRHVYGISDKVIAMALASFLMGAGRTRRGWFAVGASFVVVDTLVHNFLHRTGILDRLEPAIRMGRRATGPVAALTFLLTLPRASMPVGLIQGFRRRFPGSSPAQSGGTAPNQGSTSATAIRSMTAAGARICGAGCTAAVIASFCMLRQKQPKNRRFQQRLTSTLGCV